MKKLQFTLLAMVVTMVVIMLINVFNIYTIALGLYTVLGQMYNCFNKKTQNKIKKWFSAEED